MISQTPNSIIGGSAPSQKAPALSLVLCSRNDSYMGNSRWRLQTSINYVAKVLSTLNRLSDTEILVADWGSLTPLKDALSLSPEAAQITSFLEIPPEVAAEEQGDSPFPEVLALNAAIRRARGEFIGRIDQDTLVGRRFLQFFFSIHDQTLETSFKSDDCFMFSGRRGIPYEFASRCPSFLTVDKFVDAAGKLLPIDQHLIPPWWDEFVGILLLHRNLWFKCRAYDERLIYWGWMETDLGYRIAQKHELVNIGPLVNYDFYHLEHAHHRTPGNSRRRNTQLSNNHYIPNGETWGLSGYELKVCPYRTDPNLSEMADAKEQVELNAIACGLLALPREMMNKKTKAVLRRMFQSFVNASHE